MVKEHGGPPKADKVWKAPLDEARDATQTEAEETRFHGQGIVNGVDIEVVWDDQGDGEYRISFRQINLNSTEAAKHGIRHSYLRISNDPEEAKKVFNKLNEVAKEKGEQGKGVYKVYIAMRESLRYV